MTQNITKSWDYLPWEVQEKLLNDFFIPTDKVGVLIDEHQRPYIQTPSCL